MFIKHLCIGVGLIGIGYLAGRFHSEPTFLNPLFSRTTERDYSNVSAAYDEQSHFAPSESNWETPLLPVMKSISEGFHPVYVYRGTSNHAPPRQKASYSQVLQDNIILELFGSSSLNGTQRQPPRYFVDLAANDAVSLSNTLMLEQHGWNGLCVEPNHQYWYNLAFYRKCAVVGAFTGGAKDSEQVEVAFKGVLGGIVGSNYDTKQAKSKQTRYTVSLKSLLDQFGAPKVIDYLSLDVEGAESLVMRNFPFHEYSFSFATIERPKEDLKQILAQNNYTFVAKLSSWGETLWMHRSFPLSVDTAKAIVAQVAAPTKKLNAVVVPRSGPTR